MNNFGTRHFGNLFVTAAHSRPRLSTPGFGRR
jgi:hypothetical protein